MNEANDQRPADFYAFGKLLWCVLTGSGPRPREQQLQSGHRLIDVLEREEVTPLDALGAQLLDTDPRSRLADWRTVLAELGEVHATLTGSRTPTPAPRSIGGEAIAQARRVAALPEVQQAAADHARAKQVRDWVALLRRDLPVEMDQRLAGAVREVVDASGHELQISVGGGGHDPVELFALQPALSVPGLEIGQAQAVDGMFAAVQLLIFGTRVRFPTFRVGLYLLEFPHDLWLLAIPDLEVGDRSSVLRIPQWLLEGLPKPRGPLPYLMAHTRQAAFEMAAAVGDWFLDRLASYLRIIANGLDIEDHTAWTGQPSCPT